MKKILWLFVGLLVFGCQKQIVPQRSAESYPMQAGFRLAASDTAALRLADEVMQAQGGYENWQNTRFLEWTFFGKRHLLWDKWTGAVRVELSLDGKNTVLLNLNTGEGKAEQDGEIVTDAAVLDKLLKKAKSVWINDSYWLVMPFKLKDSGVALQYVGRDTTLTGAAAEVVELTFENVGDTPQNKYRVYIENASKLVTQWAYFSDARNEMPDAVTPWADYKKYGEILLSSNRGRNGLTNIAVHKTVDAKRFSEL